MILPSEVYETYRGDYHCKIYRKRPGWAFEILRNDAHEMRLMEFPNSVRTLEHRIMEENKDMAEHIQRIKNGGQLHCNTPRRRGFGHRRGRGGASPRKKFQRTLWRR